MTKLCFHLIQFSEAKWRILTGKSGKISKKFTKFTKIKVKLKTQEISFLEETITSILCHVNPSNTLNSQVARPTETPAQSNS